MGSPLSPLLAEIYMNNFEKIIFKSNSNLVNCIQFWARYVDDIFCIWTGTDRNLDQFLNYINSIHEKIQFTIEKENNNSINFLDLTITKNSGKLNFSIYRKPTTTDTLIHAESKQSVSIKLSPFHSLIHRLLQVPLSTADFEKESHIIKQLAIRNGYEPKMIEKMISIKQSKLIMSQFYHSQSSTEVKIWQSINYIGNVSEKMSRYLSNDNRKFISVNRSNLGALLVNNKDKTDNGNKSGVYEINCEECNISYIGCTGRSFKERIKEHKKSILNNRNLTGFSKHCVTLNHTFDEKRFKILHNVQNGIRLGLLEQLHINRTLNNPHKNICNDQVEFPSLFINAAINVTRS